MNSPASVDCSLTRSHIYILSLATHTLAIQHLGFSPPSNLGSGYNFLSAADGILRLFGCLCRSLCFARLSTTHATPGFLITQLLAAPGTKAYLGFRKVSLVLCDYFLRVRGRMATKICAEEYAGTLAWLTFRFFSWYCVAPL